MRSSMPSTGATPDPLPRDGAAVEGPAAAQLIRPAPNERRLYAAAAGLFAGTTLLTVYFTESMAGGMSMPGHWTMSMMWMVMPGQTWWAAGGIFATMWLAMMIAMMLPSALPMLLLYRRVVSFRGEPHIGLMTWLVGAGYFGVWLLFGIGAYAAGSLVAHAAMVSEAVSRGVPLGAAAALVIAGSYQFTGWKSACLRHCRDPLRIAARHLAPSSAHPASPGTRPGWRGALGLGLHHGAFCAGCCWGLMLIQLVLGMMNLGVMLLVAAVIAGEKLLARGEGIARITGAAAMTGGAVLAIRSLL